MGGCELDLPVVQDESSLYGNVLPELMLKSKEGQGSDSRYQKHLPQKPTNKCPPQGQSLNHFGKWLQGALLQLTWWAAREPGPCRSGQDSFPSGLSVAPAHTTGTHLWPIEGGSIGTRCNKGEYTPEGTVQEVVKKGFEIRWWIRRFEEVPGCMVLL